jgi:hypothetical protein
MFGKPHFAAKGKRRFMTVSVVPGNLRTRRASQTSESAQPKLRSAVSFVQRSLAAPIQASQRELSEPSIG